MNFNLRTMSTLLSNPIIEILRIQLQNTAQPQPQEKGKKSPLTSRRTPSLGAMEDPWGPEVP